MATQKVFCSYQEIIDLHTDTNKVTALGIHTPTGKTPQKMFGGFFDQFKKYKYLGCSISLVPAATLPVDPLQVSYDSPNDAVDPRDILNPILFHGCHGEDIGSILNNLYALGLANTGLMGPSTDSMDRLDFPQDEASGLDLMEKLYYKALTDNTWLKAHPQRGFRKSGLRPLVYKVNATHQIMPSDPDEIDSLEFLKGMGAPVTELMNRTPTSFYVRGRHEAKSLQFVANKLTSLGWLDTRNVIASTVKTTPDFVDPTKLNENLAEVLNAQTVVAELPKIFMGVILLSPSYQVVQHYRLICQHRFAFAGFRGISFNPSFSSPDEASPANFTGPDSDWPSDNGFGSGDDDNGDDDVPDNQITLFNANANGRYQIFQIGSGDPVTMTSPYIYGLKDSDSYDAVDYLIVSNSKILGYSSSTSQTVNFETMTYSGGDSFELATNGQFTTPANLLPLVALLHSGDYSVVVDDGE